MKKIIFLLMFVSLLATQAIAQEEDSTFLGVLYDSSDYNFETKWERLYQNVDLEQISTGFFINRAVNFIDPTKHTGRPDTDDTASFGALSSLHTALLMAEINEESIL